MDGSHHDWLDCGNKMALISAADDATSIICGAEMFPALLILASGIILMILGVILWQWYIEELAVLFFAMGVSAGLVNGFFPNRLAETFISGCRDIVSAALIVGFAGGIIVLLEEGRVMDKILFSMAATKNHQVFLKVQT